MGHTRTLPPRTSVEVGSCTNQVPEASLVNDACSSLRQDARVDERALHGVELRLSCLRSSWLAELPRDDERGKGTEMRYRMWPRSVT